MNKKLSQVALLLLLVVILPLTLASTTFKPNDKVKVGFLVHDLVSERWKMDMDNFSSTVQELGGEAIMKNAFGDAQTQIKQGKELIDQGVKVLAVVPQDGKALSELVDYANKAGAKIIAYDRMIVNCDLDYYISYNSVKVGELMANYALNLKPHGNYVILNGPSSDNNALLIKQGINNVLKRHIEKGNIKILLEKECDSWYPLSSLMLMDEFISGNKQTIDVILTGSDDLASGAIDALKTTKQSNAIVTGQDANLDACRNIMEGLQTITIYKSIKKISREAAILAMKIAKKETINVTMTLSNNKRAVPSILFDPVIIDKTNIKMLVSEGHIKESDLK